MSSSQPTLPQPKKPVKYTPASLRIMQTCDKAFHEHRFVLLYFTNRKTFNQMFTEPNFKHLVKSHFTFLQLSRADKAGNWLTTTYHFQSSPYYAILDPSTGNFITIYYGDMTLEELSGWLAKFSSKFANSTSVFTKLIEDLQEVKRKTQYAYGTKLRITFVSSKLEDKILYVNKSAPLQMAFEKYCADQNIDIDQYYFLFRGLQLPPEMTATQFCMRNGSVINVHHLEDRTSTEQISITVVGTDNNSSVFHVGKGKKIGQFLRNYCEVNRLQPANVRFTYKSDLVNDDLTFAEHNMKNGDQIYAHLKTFAPPPEYLYRLPLKPNEMPPMLSGVGADSGFDPVQMAQVAQMAASTMQIHQPGMMYMSFGNQVGQPTAPGGAATGQRPPQAMGMPSSLPQSLTSSLGSQGTGMPNSINSSLNSSMSGSINSNINSNLNSSNMNSNMNSSMNQAPQMSQMAGMPAQIPQMNPAQMGAGVPGQMPHQYNQLYPMPPSKVYTAYPSKSVEQNQNQSLWEFGDMSMQ